MDIVAVSEDLVDAPRVLELGSGRHAGEGPTVHIALGMHPEKANLGKPADAVQIQHLCDDQCGHVVETFAEVISAFIGLLIPLLSSLAVAWLMMAEDLPAMLDLIRTHAPRLACVGEVGECSCRGFSTSG
jgi:Tat protein secretion system quality control protein TatD with DNase activity